jgi:MerR family transcriptional regulator, light-induced transcriptional regulator
VAERLPVAELAKRYLASVLAGRRQEALDVLLDDGLTAALPAQRLYLEVVQRAQREIGRLWARNRIGIADEHAASAIARCAVAHLREHLPAAATNGPTVVVACVEGERHDLGAQMVADFLEMAGFTVRFLGADVPCRSLVAMIADDPPAMVALSAGTVRAIPSLRRTVAALRRVMRDRIRLAAGGHAFTLDAELRKSLPLDTSAADAAEAVVAIQFALGI